MLPSIYILNKPNTTFNENKIKHRGWVLSSLNNDSDKTKKVKHLIKNQKLNIVYRTQEE